MVGADGPRKFLKVNPSKLAKISLFRLGFNKNLSQNMNTLERNKILYQKYENKGFFITPDSHNRQW